MDFENYDFPPPRMKILFFIFSKISENYGPKQIFSDISFDLFYTIKIITDIYR